jgi:acetylornithine deacetylase/succinyl-diaminopimelate desuccinylase-like protein
MVWLDDAAGDVDTMRREIGLGVMPVSDGRAALERLLYFSGCNVAGFVAGGVGAEGRNIVPATAEASLEFRLVPDQEPETVYRQLVNHLVVNGYGDIETSFVHGVLPARTAPDHPLVPAALGAIEATYGQPAVVHPNSPGTGPMSKVCHSRGLAAIAMGVGHPASNTHAPNENIGVADFRFGIEVVADFLRRFAES